VPLAGVLAVQAVLSLRLLRADTAFQGEAASLWAGHLKWAHWLHGAPIPAFPKFFSGTPVLYPPLGAAADSVGGLAGARALSLVFMLGATVILWATAGRLFGRGAAFFAAALFATLGPVLHLGAFATYDALAVFLVAVASWCLVRAPGRGHAAGWMAGAGVALALASAVAYATVVFDLFVAALALLTAIGSGGVLVAARRAAMVLIMAVGLLAAGLLAGGGSYLGGFARTTLARVPGSATPVTVLDDSWRWAGLLIVLAVGGIIASAASRQPVVRTWLLVVLSAAAVAGPLNQARLHTAAMLDKHLGLGAWFAAIAAGYGVHQFIAAAPAARTRALTCGACVMALAFPAQIGASQSKALSVSWPKA
jgi:4-amino-4-deoxy-L-arabinose transferase-like glycosyltransferase